MVSAILEGKPDKNLILVTGRIHPKLAEDVAEQLGIDVLETTAYDFANGEMYVRYTESVRGADVFVLQSHYKPINKAIMEHVIYANARVAAERGGTTICCTRYGNVMCSRGSVIPLFIDQIRAGNPITITDPNMTRFLMNLDEAVDLVMFAFEHANPGDLFIQKSDASTIGDLAKAVQQLFGDTGTNIIGTRHGEKLFETLMTREERLRSEDMGGYYRVAADNRDLNYDKFVVKGEVHTMADDSYTSHNTHRLDVEGTVRKILTTDYVQNALKEMEAEKA